MLTKILGGLAEGCVERLRAVAVCELNRMVGRQHCILTVCSKAQLNCSKRNGDRSEHKSATTPILRQGELQSQRRIATKSYKRRATRISKLMQVNANQDRETLVCKCYSILLTFRAPLFETTASLLCLFPPLRCFFK